MDISQCQNWRITNTVYEICPNTPQQKWGQLALAYFPEAGAYQSTDQDLVFTGKTYSPRVDSQNRANCLSKCIGKANVAVPDRSETETTPIDPGNPSCRSSSWIDQGGYQRCDTYSVNRNLNAKPIIGAGSFSVYLPRVTCRDTQCELLPSIVFNHCKTRNSTRSRPGRFGRANIHPILLQYLGGSSQLHPLGELKIWQC